MTGQIARTTPAPIRTTTQPSTPPAKASEATSSIPTRTNGLVQPLSVGSYAFPARPDGVAPKQFEKQATLKQVGNPKETGLVVGRAELSGQSYFDHGPRGVQGQAKGQASLTAVGGRFEKKHEGRLGTTQVRGEFEVGATVKGEAGTKLSRAQAAVVGHASAEGFAGARGELHVEQKQGRHFSQTLDGSVKAGAEANAVATFAFEPKKGTAMAKVGFGAKAGAEESASGELKLGVVRLSAGISAQQGVSSSFGVGAGIQDGRAMVSLDVGAAVGLGASVNLGVSVNTRAIAHKAHAAGHKVKEAAHAVKAGARQLIHA